MRKSIKRAFAAILALAMTCASFTVPVFADDYTPLFEGDTVLNEWKFDFGSEDNVADGYTAVTADRNYITAGDYGFLGIDENAHKISERYDGFGNQEGQVIELKAGGNGENNPLNDGIGSVGEDMYGNAGDKYYPTRFALKVADEQYFRIRATVTTLDPEKDANVTLYTERKHPIVKNKTVRAGATYTVDFSIRTTPIYYEKSTPKGSIADGMVNVCVLGENSALAALEIQQVESFPTMWVLGDSTVTDGNCALPFFEPQNYTGVGTGLTMYLPRNMAMVNEGEGGLAAGDNAHFNMVKDRIKAGDYMYVEYGHNHKDDGTAGYLSCLDKYYNACHDVGAKLLIVSPIERINTFTDGAYQQTLNGFADVGEQYVADKVAAGAEDIAYVDLNDLSIKWYNEITEANDGSATAIKYYFQTAKNAKTDATHPNDKGAEWLAYKFMQAAQAVTDETQKAVVSGFLTGMTEETPTLISEEITAGGVGGSAWPTYIVPTSNKYPVVIKDIKVAEDGSVESVDVEVQQAEFAMSAYGIIIITVSDENGNEKGKIYAVDQVDNSTGVGEQTITNFTGDVTIGETDTYTAVVMQALDTEDGLKLDEEANKAYSPVYAPTDIEKHLITDEDNNGGEDFDFYGAVYEGDSVTKLTAYNNWMSGGSAGITLDLGIDGDVKYTNLQTDGAKTQNGVVSANQGSFYVWKNLSEAIGTTGRYMISADMRYVSGAGMDFKLMQGVSDKVLWGSDGITAFKVGENGVITSGEKEVGAISAVDFTNVKWIIDMDRAVATVTVGDGDPVEYTVSNYATTETTVTPTELTSFQAALNKAACAVQMSNLVVAKLKDTKLPEYKIEVATLNKAKDWGTVKILPIPTPTVEPTVEPTAEPTAEPTPTPTPAVGKLTLKDCSGKLDDDKICSDYAVSVTDGEEYSTINVTAKNLKSYTYSNQYMPAYWIGAAITAPDGAEITDYNTASTKDECAKDLSETGDQKQRLEFWMDAAGSSEKWVYIKLNDGREFIYKFDLSGVELAKDPTVTTAKLHDASGTVADDDLYTNDTYSIEQTAKDDNGFNYSILDIYAYGLKVHQNALGNSGAWVGAAVTAPEGTTIESYYFGADEYSENSIFTETAEDDKETIEFYVNAVGVDKTKWAAVKLDDGRVYVYKLLTENVSAAVGKPTVTTAKLHDWATDDPIADAYICWNNNYGINQTEVETEGKYVYDELAIYATYLNAHTNAENEKGYWVGAAVTAPAGTTIEGYYFSKDQFTYDNYGEVMGPFEETTADDKETIEFYVSVLDRTDSVWAAIKLSNGDIYKYKITLQGVSFADSPSVTTAKLHDASESDPESDEDLYKKDSYLVTPNNAKNYTELQIKVQDLKYHANANGNRGAWVGAAITAREGTTIEGYYFGTEEYSIDTCTFTTTAEDDKETIEFYVDASQATYKQWVAVKLDDGRVYVYKLNLDGVELEKPNPSEAPVDNDDDEDVSEAPAVENMSLLADGTEISVKFEDGKVKLTSTGAGSAIILEAVYDENNVLKALYPTEVKFEGAGTQEFTLRTGCKVMVWDSLENAKPLAPVQEIPAPQPTTVPSATPTATPDTTPSATPSTPDTTPSTTPTTTPSATPTIPTPTPDPSANIIVVADKVENVALNTAVTIVAEPNEGYVFMGWKNENGETVSTDAEYTFRLREDTLLYADFAKEPGIENVVNYTLSAENAFIKATEGNTTTMKITDCVDSENTPFTKVSNTDAQWVCTETGITVDANGVVTVGADFSMGDSIEKEVTVKAILNGIEKTCVLTLHTYNICEDFSNVTDTWGFTTSGGVNVTDGVLNLLVSSNANGNSVQTKTLDEDITSSKKIVAKFDIKSGIENGKGRNAYFALKDSDGNMIFMIYADGKNGLYYSTTGTDSTTKFAGHSASWYTVNVTADFETNKVAATISDASGKTVATLAETDITTGAANLGQLYATNTYSAAPISVDNVFIKAY